MAETGNKPREITYGILKSLQKLFSSLGKILVACIINRMKDRFEAKIKPSQAAYRPNRVTTKHIFNSKLIIERTITERVSVHLIILRVKRSTAST